MKDNPGKPERRAVKLLAKGTAVGAGAESGGDGDPVVHGGFLRVLSASGDGFNATYGLPADRWRYKGKPEKHKGYKLAGAGPIVAVQVKPGKALKEALG